MAARAEPPGRPGGGATRASHAVIVADGDVPSRAALDAAWPGWAADVAMVIAADGGLERAEALGLRPTLLVGDLDSLDPARADAAAAGGVAVQRSPVDKDESDTELAIVAAVRLAATRLTVLGALGGPRVDHALANLWLLAHPALAAVEVALLDERVRIRLIAAPHPDGTAVEFPLPGPVGGLVSLLPFGGDVDGVTTTGLRYPLVDEPLTIGPARGLSNVRAAPDAAVTVRRGRLLVVETARPALETALRPAGLSSPS